jgi:hypothetical protein
MLDAVNSSCTYSRGAWYKSTSRISSGQAVSDFILASEELDINPLRGYLFVVATVKFSREIPVFFVVPHLLFPVGGGGFFIVRAVRKNPPKLYTLFYICRLQKPYLVCEKKHVQFRNKSNISWNFANFHASWGTFFAPQLLCIRGDFFSNFIYMSTWGWP